MVESMDLVMDPVPGVILSAETKLGLPGMSWSGPPLR